MNFRRLAFVLAVPVAFYAYACSSSSTSEGPKDSGSSGNPTTDNTDSGNNDDTPDTGSDIDSGDDGGQDSGPTCVGNPLTADGGTADGGSNLDAGVTTMILDEKNATGGVFAFADGPQFIDFDGGGALVFSEISDPPSIIRLNPDGSGRAPIRTTGAGGASVIGNSFRGNFVLTTVSGTGTSTIYQTLPDGGAGTSITIDAGTNPNDLVVSKGGDIYYTDPQYQTGGPVTSLVRVALNGTNTTIATFSLGERPNGIALSPDGTKLYVSFTDSKKVSSYPVATNGSVTNTPTTVVSATIDAPDGIAVDVGGNIWVAEANDLNSVNSGRVEVFSPAGKRLGEIPFPTSRPTGVAFGGTDNKSVFVTTESGINGPSGIWKYTSRCAGIR